MKTAPAPQLKNLSNNYWLFVLGREPLLSAAEIKAVFEREKNNILNWEIKKDKYLIINLSEEFDAKILMDNLGGTIKIGQLIDIRNTPEELAQFLNEHLTAGKINFSIDGNVRANYGLEIKKILKGLERSVRYIEPKNTATILHNNLIEKGADLTIVDGQIFITKAIQPFEAMGERDFGRPGRDDLSGMLPPKLAMMMINLSGAKKEDILLDPFCGSGTIITEAMLMGYKNIIGSDISEKAVEDTNKNIEWTKTNIKPKILKANISELSNYLSANSIDIVITEPFLGKPLKGKETKEELLSQKNELQKLYLQAFEQFSTLLKSGSNIIFIFPKFKFGQEWISTNCSLEIKKMGFDDSEMMPNHKSLIYLRPDQKVAREIIKFKKK